MTEKASAYEKVTRTIVENLSREVRDGFCRIDKRMEDLGSSYTKLFNHYSNRIPPWVTILFTIGGSLITGLIIQILK